MGRSKVATSIYIQDETKGKLERLANAQKRTLEGQIHFMCDAELLKLNIPADDSQSSESDITQIDKESQNKTAAER